MVSSDEIYENDCCGNGCTNCILDKKSTPPSATTFNNKINCLSMYRKYELIEKEFLHSNIVKLKFQLNPIDDTDLILHLPAGHHLMMKYQNLRRPYSPYSVAPIELTFEFLVNLSPNGKMSKCIENEFQIGQLVEFRGPIGKFHHQPNEYDLMIFSQGVGIAPIIRVIEEILQNEEDFTRIYYFGCFTDLAKIFFRPKLTEEYQKFWNFKSKLYLSREICKFENCPLVCQHFKAKLKYNEHIFPYRLSKNEILENLVALKKLDNLRILICGSKEFENFVKNSLREINSDFFYIL